MHYQTVSINSGPRKGIEQILLQDRARHMGDRMVIKHSQHGVTKGMTTLVAFYNGVIASEDKEKATHVIYPDICKAL